MMHIHYSDERDTQKNVAQLSTYREYIQNVVSSGDLSRPESALITWQDELMREGIGHITGELGTVRDVILIGIGGSSLGTEAVHAALRGHARLHVLDAVSPERISTVINAITDRPREQIAVCIVSKSGSTTETLTNAGVFLHELAALYGDPCYDRVVCIGDPGNELLTTGEALGTHILPMHESIGGRYSVFTAVGLVPLALLGYDTDALLAGLHLATKETEQESVNGAATLSLYLAEGVHTVNFFAFDLHLIETGHWYRQLTAESLGKEHDRDGNEVHAGFVPTIATPVELHSIGQLYFSGLPGIFTDFVRFTEEADDYSVPANSQLASQLSGRSMHEISEAIFGGVVGAYEKRDLPHRITELASRDEETLGHFMGARMLETMYLAELLNVNAFDQPNVELYKDITRDILDT